MPVLIYVLLLLVPAVYTLLIVVGGRALRRRVLPPEAAGVTFPPVSLIVPVTGAPPGLAARLTSLLTQDYPDYEVIFASRSMEDPATPIILAAAARGGNPRVRQVIAGTAVACGQKNYNLLAGLRLISPETKILAFCDSNQEAPLDWLRNLVYPVAAGVDAVSSCYYHVLPENASLATLARAISTLTIFVAKGVQWLNQPWGGSTAISRTVFEDLKIARLWAENVVDDVSLAARLVQAGILTALSAGPPLTMPLAGETWGSFQDWLFRQWFYLKYCLPGSWLAGGLLQHLLAAGTLLSAILLVAYPLGRVGPAPALVGAYYLTTLSALGLALRQLHPRPGPKLRWLAAFYAAIAMSSWCHLLNCLTHRLCWRAICYRITWRGRVTEIKEG